MVKIFDERLYDSYFSTCVLIIETCLETWTIHGVCGWDTFDCLLLGPFVRSQMCPIIDHHWILGPRAAFRLSPSVDRLCIILKGCCLGRKARPILLGTWRHLNSFCDIPVLWGSVCVSYIVELKNSGNRVRQSVADWSYYARSKRKMHVIEIGVCRCVVSPSNQCEAWFWMATAAAAGAALAREGFVNINYLHFIQDLCIHSTWCDF